MNHLTDGNPDLPAEHGGALSVASGLVLADGDAAAVLRVQRSLVPPTPQRCVGLAAAV
ncbi:hypothetical protein [Mesorhizobium sp. Mes31]|uniref:hypothetical protein n=1 Tax=Mesorhizobium sp. Mes31 TaxID=2926017 RepID=UPI0021175EF5|nr:hypothetical protein [Mesorhizobium sp. Mes31]